MPFKKGNKAGKNGRPKGSGHKKPLRLKIEGLLEKTFPQIEQEIETATPEDRRSFFVDLTKICFSNKNQTA